MVAKANPGERWRRAFIGDPEGARCCDAPPCPPHSQQQPPPRGGDCCRAARQQAAPTGECDSAAGIASPGVRAPGGDLIEEACCPSAYLLTQLDQGVILELQVCSQIKECVGAVRSDSAQVADCGPAPHYSAYACSLQRSLSMIRCVDAHIDLAISALITEHRLNFAPRTSAPRPLCQTGDLLNHPRPLGTPPAL